MVTIVPFDSVALPSKEVRTLRSAQLPVGQVPRVVMSMVRNLNRETGRPVLFVKVRRTCNAPRGPFGSGAVVLTRFGGVAEDTVGSSKDTPMVVLLTTG